MAYVSSHHASSTVRDLIGALVARVKAGVARRAIYAQTLSELQSLSDRDLRDLGISPSSIYEVAREAAAAR